MHCNPVFVSYLLIASNKATLYVNKEKVDGEVLRYLKEQGVEVADYAEVGKGLQDYFEYNILIDPDEVCYTLYQKVTRNIVRGTSPIAAMKAVKNERERLCFRSAMLRDGIAMVKFLKWLDESIGRQTLTEISVADKLEALRAEQPLYRGLSFDTIAGYEAHGAIVHYEATPETDAVLQPKGLLLLDSGAQYQDGTTDITRTIALGPLTEEQRRVYTGAERTYPTATAPVPGGCQWYATRCGGKERPVESRV